MTNERQLPHFEVDKEGLRLLLAGRPPAFMIYELVSNAWDENTTQVLVDIAPVPGSPYVTIRVEDDSPDGFALALDTPIPTPSGWTTMAEVGVGDMLYDEDGNIQQVVAKSPVLRDHEVYEITFEDGDSVVADVNHCWTVTTSNQRAKGLAPTTRTTRDLALAQTTRNQGFSPGIQPVLAAPSLPLLLDPYLLGYWLGDGVRGTGAVACAEDDAEHVRAIGVAAGFEVSREADRTIYLRGLLPILRAMGVAEDKHIPPSYLRADERSRLALLRGLADSDGSSASVRHNRRSAFYNTNLALVEGFAELVCSLGGVCSIRVNSAVAEAARRPGREIGGHAIVQRKDLYAVSFTVPQGGHYMKRKAADQSLATERQRRRVIRAITPVGRADVQCLTTSASSGLFLCGRSMVATHNCDLSHAYTLFAPSLKKDNPEQRGRFNLGEKLVLAVCQEAEISSTKGTVQFDRGGRRLLRRKRDAGTVFTGKLRLTRSEMADVLAGLQLLLPPGDVTTVVNGETIEPRPSVCHFDASLETERQDAEGNLRPTRRSTAVELYALREDEHATLYELGIPVVAIEGSFHVNVLQKVPLNTDRDNVRGSFLRELMALVLNEVVERDLLVPSMAQETWVSKAIEHPQIAHEAVGKVIDLRFGKKRVTYDPSDPEANRIAASRGFTVIPSNALSKPAWQNVREAEASKPAGQVTPSPKPFSLDGRPLKTIDPKDYDADMRALVAYAIGFACVTIGHGVSVVLARDFGWQFAGAYGGGELTLNLSRGRFDYHEPDVRLDELLIHELAHEYGGHLSAEFDRGLARVGAAAIEAARAGKLSR